MKKALALFKNGWVYFSQSSKTSSVSVEIVFFNVTKGYHGIHIHNKPLTPKLLKQKNCCDALGGHWNADKPLWSLTTPNGTKHGKHAGDLCFNFYSNGKFGYKKFKDSKISLYKGKKYIGKRSIIIHKNKDDRGKGNNEESWKTGNAGRRIGCANIILQ